MEIGGNGTFIGTGSIYIPSAQFVFDGNPSSLTGSQLIARTVNIQHGNISINYNPTTTAQPILPRLAQQTQRRRSRRPAERQPFLFSPLAVIRIQLRRDSVGTVHEALVR